MRLVTRGDLDGLTCAVLITSVERIFHIELTHPQELTDRRFEVQPGDIIANLPYHENCSLWFDHHLQTETNKKPPQSFKGRYGLAPSAARLVYEYYSELKGPGVFSRFDELVAETDRLDSANLTVEDVVDPKRIIQLGFTIDSRTGLKGFKDYFLFLGMALRSMTLEEVLASEQVVQRITKMREDDARFREALLASSRVEGQVVVTDFRNLEEIPVGNRFLIYTLFQECPLSLRLQWGPRRETVMATAGKNVFDRSSPLDLGHVMARFGGGGHTGAGSAPIPANDGDATLTRLVAELNGKPV